MDKIVKDFIDNVAPYWVLWTFGWLAMYLNKVRNWVQFRIGAFIINGLLSGWIWIVVYSILPDSLWAEKIALVSISGFLSYPILSFLESEAFNLFLNKYWLWQPKDWQKK